MKHVLVLRKGDNIVINDYFKQFNAYSDEELVKYYNQQVKAGITGVHQQALSLCGVSDVFIRRFGKSPIQIRDNVISLTGICTLKDGEIYMASEEVENKRMVFAKEMILATIMLVLLAVAAKFCISEYNDMRSNGTPVVLAVLFAGFFYLIQQGLTTAIFSWQRQSSISVSIFLLLGVLNMSYEYYLWLKNLVFMAGISLVFWHVKTLIESDFEKNYIKEIPIPLMLLSIAILFNPFVLFYFDKTTWIVIDISAIIIYNVASILQYKRATQDQNLINSSRYMQSDLMKKTVELGLSTSSSEGSDEELMISQCPKEGSHSIRLDAENDMWQCEKCNIGGGISEFELYHYLSEEKRITEKLSQKIEFLNLYFDENYTIRSLPEWSVIKEWGFSEQELYRSIKEVQDEYYALLPKLDQVRLTLISGDQNIDEELSKHLYQWWASRY